MNELQLAFDYWKNSTFNGYENPHTRLMKAIAMHLLTERPKTEEAAHTELFTRPEELKEQVVLPKDAVEHKNLGAYLNIVEFCKRYPFASGTHMRKMCRFDNEFVARCTMRIPGRKKGEYLLNVKETINFFNGSNKYKIISNRLQSMIRNAMIVV